MIPEKVQTIMKTLLDAGYEAYIIGGAVRDLFLGAVPHDYDVFTNASGKEILRLFPKGIVLGGEERQAKILTVIIDGIEVSQYRSNGDRTETGNSLQQHIMTCDFTMNAMAMDINEKIIDIVDGKEHILFKVLMFVGNPKDRITEDPLRLLRAVRFISKYDLQLSQMTAISENLSLIKTLPKERIRDELLKIMSYTNGMERLWASGLLSEILPEYKSLHKVEGGQHHNEQVGTHLMNAFRHADSITDNVLLKLACFLHDIGKGQAFSKEEDGSVHFYKHEIIGEDIVRKWMTEYRFSNEDIKYVTTLIRTHMYSYKAEPSKRSYLKFFRELQVANIDIHDYIILLYCDHQANQAKPRIKFGDFVKGNWLLKNYNELTYANEPLSIKDLVVSGKDLIERFGLTQGPEIGTTLQELFDKVMDGDLKNERAELLNYLKVKKDGD